MAMCIDVFDDWLSWIHFGLGFAAAFLKYIHIYLYIGIILVFLVYEAVESWDLEEFLGDVAEFGFGYLVGDLVATIQRAVGTSPSAVVWFAAAAVAAALVAAQNLEH